MGREFSEEIMKKYREKEGANQEKLWSILVKLRKESTEMKEAEMRSKLEKLER